MSRSRTLVQVNSSFDFYMITSMIGNQFEPGLCDLLIPKTLVRQIPERLLSRYQEVHEFNPKLKNLFSPRALYSTWALVQWAKKYRSRYTKVVFGSYRDTTTSILAKWFKGGSELVAVKQGIDLPLQMFKPFFSLRHLHDYVYFYMFGYSSFKHVRLNGAQQSSAYLFDRPIWQVDPFCFSDDIYTIGKLTKLTDGSRWVLPQLDSFIVKKKETRSGILIVGERTPMVPSWGEQQDEILSEIFKLFIDQLKDQTVFVRARKSLTNKEFYRNLNPVFLDPEQPFDDQLLQLNPKVVLSVKSTAVKVASYYGFNSYLLYPSLMFNDDENLHLNHLFGDGAPIDFVSSADDLKSILSGIG